VERRKDRKDKMTSSADRPFNLALVVVPIATALALAASILDILKLGAAPMAGLIVLLWLVPVFCNRPHGIVLLWLGIPLITEITTNRFLSIGSIGPIVLLPADIPYFFTIVYLVVAAGTRPRQTFKTLRTDRFLALFLLMVVVSVLISSPGYGKMAIGDARKTFFFLLFPLLAAMSIKTLKDLRRLALDVHLLAICMSVVGYAVLILHPTIDRFGFVNGEAALVVLFALFSALIFHANGLVLISRAVDAVTFVLFLSVLVISRSRNVFLAAGLGMLCLYVLRRDKGVLLLKTAVLAAVLGAAVWMAFESAPSLTGEFMKPLAGLLHPYSDQNATWRMEGWRKRLAPLSDSELLFGAGLGNYTSWHRGKQVIKAGAHDVYVEIVLKLGVLGLVIYALLVFSFLRRMLLVRNKLPKGLVRACVEAAVVNFIAAQASMIAYDFSLITMVFYGLGIAGAGLAASEEAQTGAQAHETYNSAFSSGSYCGEDAMNYPRETSREIRALAR
jgi:O-Antigen ligase